ITNHMQNLGYFSASVRVTQVGGPDSKELRIMYTINPGDRHKLAAIRIRGNKLFDTDQIRAVMDEQPSGRLFSHGRYNELLLASDVDHIQALYRASGYRQAEVTSQLIEKYHGDPSLLAIDISIKEGPQTLVSSLTLDGNYNIPSDQLLTKLQ